MGAIESKTMYDMINYDKTDDLIIDKKIEYSNNKYNIINNIINNITNNINNVIVSIKIYCQSTFKIY